ncbi:hypothetical protein PybrP1_002541 [[Pythium] brassicae (nom. inval.)]|nr:hypothetical protein PybrP1_002541 [[Pythium] brassicae (nom. inval.)]
MNSDGTRGDVGAVPYERVLTLAECTTIERTAHKLARLDAFVHVWVRDARSFRHGKESAVPAFSLRLHPSVPVAEIRDMIQEKFAELSDYSEEREGCLRLLFDSRVLENDKPLAAYLAPRDSGSSTASPSERNARSPQQASWAKPFAGIVWVIPFRPGRATAIDWAS